MKRDADLIRKLLLLIEQNGPAPIKARSLEVTGYSDTEIMSNLNLLSDAGFIVAEHSRSSTNRDRVIATELVFDLTWKGHEYLDAVRDSETWRKTKAIAKKSGNTTFEFVVEIAKGLARDALKTQGLSF